MSSAVIRFVSVYRFPDREELLYRLLQERPKNMNISHREMPSLQEHRRFIQSKPYKEWNFIRIDGQTVRSLYLTSLNEIGIFLFSKFRGTNLEREIIKTFIGRRRHLRLLANVSPDNPLYASIFRQLGFKLIQHSYCLEPASR